MKITFRAKGIKLTPQLEDYTREKISKLEKYLGEVIEAWVELIKDRSQRSGKKFQAEVQIKLPKGSLRADETTTDIFAAIDLVLPKLKKEIERYKDRKKLPRRKRGIKGLRE